MKKFILGLFFLVIVNGLFVGTTAEATIKSEATDVGVMFNNKKVQQPIVPKLPDTNVPYIPKPSPSFKGNLPSTGDLITSLIWTLLGCAVLIMFVGVFSLKNIMLRIT
ncbi:hypothetical protein ABID30_002024 [Enterococcus rotai]|uniref:Uncharacterized protein n=1 Tax=Enterococcus rotai TaxID=118060 RepID=A0A0U2VGK0_9ENTE|nr:hypothetical protein [Enterococcus rotai]ALS36780.1 hypothetical protein ATZ35_06305 [Enterococcus rotai]